MAREALAGAKRVGGGRGVAAGGGVAMVTDTGASLGFHRPCGFPGYFSMKDQSRKF